MVDIKEVPTKITPSFTFQNSKEVAVLSDGRKIVHALISKHHIDQMRICSDTKILIDKAGFTSAGIPQFIGFDQKDVEARFSELKEDAIRTEDTLDKILKHRWTSQDAGAMAGYFVVGSADIVKFKAVMKSTKELDVAIIQAKPEYDTIKEWVEDLVIEKEFELKEANIVFEGE